MKNLFLLILLFTAISLSAQKLPNVQETSLRAPAGIKVDGKDSEWNGVFKAYNKATNVFYSVSNDDKKLYLVVQANDRQIITKIMNGGISFSINVVAKKKSDKDVSVTFPLFNRGNRPSLSVIPQDVAERTPKEELIKLSDSIAMENNLRLVQKAKTIRVLGIAGLDSLISVYNDEGILAAAEMNNKQAFVYELSIELKRLNLDLKNPVKLFYNVQLNPLPQDEIPGIYITRSATGEITSVNINSSVARPYSQVMFATDFWGEYTLAK